MPLESDPPRVALVIGEGNYSFECITKTGDFAINVPPAGLKKAVIGAGSVSGRRVDKFKKLGLTPIKARKIAAPLIEECVANLECRLVGQMTSGDHTIFVGEILAVWVNEHPKRLLCAIDQSGGYDFLLERSGYRFGVVKA